MKVWARLVATLTGAAPPDVSVCSWSSVPAAFATPGETSRASTTTVKVETGHLAFDRGVKDRAGSGAPGALMCSGPAVGVPCAG
jgi:hypothetical protein